MFSIGFFEFCIIALGILVLFGPDKLPQMMRQAGKLFVQARRTSQELKQSFEQALADAEREADAQKTVVLPRQEIVLPHAESIKAEPYLPLPPPEASPSTQPAKEAEVM